MKKYNKAILESKRRCKYESPNSEPKLITFLDVVYDEINIWKYLNHPNICKLYQIIDDPNDKNTYLVIQLCEFG